MVFGGVPSSTASGGGGGGMSRRKCVGALKSITVEPILFLTMLSMHVSQVIQQVGIYRVICQQIYVDHPEIDCAHLANVTVDGVPAEFAVQKRMTTWNMALGVAYLAPALVADIFLGAYGDRYGRKVNMLLGMTGLMISLYPLILQFTFPVTMPLYILVIAHLITGFTGFISIAMISCFAYLSDTVLDSDVLTIRMALMSVVMNLGTVVGPLIAGATAKSLTLPQAILNCQVFLTAAFLLCMFTIRQVPPAQLRRELREKRDKELKEQEQLQHQVEHGGGNGALMMAPVEESHQMKNLNHHQRMITSDSDNRLDTLTASTTPVAEQRKETLCTLVGNLLKETWHTYTKPRPGNVRTYLVITALVFFLHMISEMGIRTSIFALYVQKAPLSWDQDMIGYFKSAQSAMIMCGTIFGVVIFKKVFNFTDTFIIIVANIAHIFETITYAFATSTWICFLAAAFGTLSGLAMPCTQSFLAKQVGSDEVGKAYTAFGIAANIGLLISNAIYNPIYAATVSFFPGFVFLFAAALLTVALGAVVWMHFDVHFKTQEADVPFKTKLVRSLFSAQKRDMPASTTSGASPTVGFGTKVTPVDVAAANPEKMK